jgi:hypothetical protein
MIKYVKHKKLEKHSVAIYIKINIKNGNSVAIENTLGH